MALADRDATRRAFSKPAAFDVLIEGLTLKTELTAERLRELLDYDPATGRFTWRSRSRSQGTEQAGHIERSGYRAIRIDNQPFKAHRLAWLYMTGGWPAQQIDHVNRIRGDNRFANLREASPIENAQNKSNAPGSTGFVGVTWHEHAQRFSARIRVNKRRRHLGYFKCPRLASDAYQAARAALHPFGPEEGKTCRHS